eukprot:3107260-Rhodomonas_salina.4
MHDSAQRQQCFIEAAPSGRQTQAPGAGFSHRLRCRPAVQTIRLGQRAVSYTHLRAHETEADL